MLRMVLAATLAVSGTFPAAYAAGLTVGVLRSNFQEERWTTDKAAIKAALYEAGAASVSADAQSSSAK